MPDKKCENCYYCRQTELCLNFFIDNPVWEPCDCYLEVEEYKSYPQDNDSAIIKDILMRDWFVAKEYQ